MQVLCVCVSGMGVRWGYICPRVGNTRFLCTTISEAVSTAGIKWINHTGTKEFYNYKKYCFILFNFTPEHNITEQDTLGTHIYLQFRNDLKEI